MVSLREIEHNGNASLVALYAISLSPTFYSHQHFPGTAIVVLVRKSAQKTISVARLAINKQQNQFKSYLNVDGDVTIAEYCQFQKLTENNLFFDNYAFSVNNTTKRRFFIVVLFGICCCRREFC
jgi:hypothetical protein